MADFRWIETPKQGVCIFCGTSAEQRGFVDMIADVDVRNGDYQIVGNVDVCACGKCLEQAARLVGSATQEETLAMAQKVIDSGNEVEKLKDEVQAWTQRYNNLVDKLSTENKPKKKVAAKEIHA